MMRKISVPVLILSVVTVITTTGCRPPTADLDGGYFGWLVPGEWELAVVLLTEFPQNYVPAVSWLAKNSTDWAGGALHGIIDSDNVAHLVVYNALDNGSELPVFGGKGPWTCSGPDDDGDGHADRLECSQVAGNQFDPPLVLNYCPPGTWCKLE